MRLERICCASIVSCEILHSLGIGKSVFTWFIWSNDILSFAFIHRLIYIYDRNNLKAESNKMRLERICCASIVSWEILHSLGIGKSVFT